jgi:hypothetical protein
VLKKLQRPLLVAHLRQINRELSPDHLAFQIARTTISPNYLKEFFWSQTARSWWYLQTYLPNQEKKRAANRV